MKLATSKLLLIFAILLFALQAQAQPFSNRVSEEITVSGYAMVDSTMHHARYALDTDGDSVADYRLNFGPFWYQPDSSTASRPEDGQWITVYGGVRESQFDSVSVIVVYEIDGQFWRDPYEPFWLGFARRHHPRGFSHRNHRGFAFGWINDSLPEISVEGVVRLDTTTHIWHYYLDTNNDSVPEYFLNFGPPWYQPDSLTTRPDEGDVVQIDGFLAEHINRLPMIFVKELNGQTWMDSVAWRHYKQAFRVKHRDRRVHRIFCPYDSLSGFRIKPGWANNMHGMGMNDETVFQMLQLLPQDVPEADKENVFAAFEIAAFDMRGRNMMETASGMVGEMRLANKASMQLHYNKIQELGYGINEQTIRVKVWDSSEQTWRTVSDAQVDPETNTVTYESSSLNGLVILTAETTTMAVSEPLSVLPEGFSLKQNYPNPFNPVTTIPFAIKEAGVVQLTVYNTLGQKIRTLVNQKLNPGEYNIRWDAGNLPSGIYFYELKYNGKQSVRRMTLIK
ncbi:MAG: T9SS type A sorting domain-containing protein [Calditrichaeota bacterium]|nr:T9SS type A sorting domain-containing protein [Calditrichota bacterium]